MATKPTDPKTPVPDKPAASTAVAAPRPTQVAMPMDWRERMKQVAVKAAETEKPTSSFISFKSGRLSIGEVTMKDDKIECIIIDSLLHNKYFNTQYNANKQVPPVCYAFAREEENLQPTGPNGEDEDAEGYNPGAEDPQSDYCADCPQNEWGSAGGGSRGKACTNSRRLWLLPAEAMNSIDKAARLDLLQCDLPATSVVNYSKFANDAAGSGLPPFAYVVEMSVKPHPNFLFQVHFKAMEQIKNEGVLEALANRNWRHEQEPFPMYPTKEELAERAAGGTQSTKY